MTRPGSRKPAPSAGRPPGVCRPRQPGAGGSHAGRVAAKRPAGVVRPGFGGFGGRRHRDLRRRSSAGPPLGEKRMAAATCVPAHSVDDAVQSFRRQSPLDRIAATATATAIAFAIAITALSGSIGSDQECVSNPRRPARARVEATDPPPASNATATENRRHSEARPSAVHCSIGRSNRFRLNRTASQSYSAWSVAAGNRPVCIRRSSNPGCGCELQSPARRRASQCAPAGFETQSVRSCARCERGRSGSACRHTQDGSESIRRRLRESSRAGSSSRHAIMSS